MNGFDYDLAESWSETERMARVIIIGEMKGLVWEWDRNKWKDPPKG